MELIWNLGFNAIKLRGIIVIPNEVRNLYIPINYLVNRFLALLEMTRKFLNLMTLIWDLLFGIFLNGLKVHKWSKKIKKGIIMEPSVIYNIHNGETFGILIAIYFYLTGLSAGSFILSTLAYGFGIEKYKPLGKIGVVLATLLLVIAPLFLLLHSGRPMRAWHLFFLLRGTSPITWGSFLLTLYPINCLIYGFFMFRDYKHLTKIFGLIGIPLAIAVHGYTGFILSFGKARALWNSSLMPLLFLVSAMVSGIALMILVSFIKDKFFSKDKKVNRELIFDLAKILGWVIVFDLFLMFSEIITHFVSHKEAYEVNLLLLTGSFALWFIGIETLVGKIIPLGIVLTPKFRTLPAIIIAAVLVIVGIFVMRYNVVLGGEYLPLI